MGRDEDSDHGAPDHGLNVSPVVRTEAEWKAILTPEQFRVARLKGTERAFTGEFDKNKRPGDYHCVCCDLFLFRSDDKFDSGCGWPSFTQAHDNGSIKHERDTSHGMVRIEVLCSRCDAHLGHVFPDGPPPLRTRYCINSVSLTFRPAQR